MYNSNEHNKGRYSKLDFLKRGFELVSPIEFFKMAKAHTPEIGLFRLCIMLIDFYVCIVRYGTIASDYFEYEFWKKKACVRKTYITMLKSIRMQRFFNQGSPELLVNKRKFNEYFKSLRNVRNFYFDKSRSFDDFYRFVLDCNSNIIVKPFWGASGIGIYKPDVNTKQKSQELYDKISTDGRLFCEECYIQTGVLNEVNPNCVNTIRIYTLYDGEKVHIMNSCVRFGGGTACVDNIHSGGMCCDIDKTLGIIVGPGYNLMNQRYITHSVTGVALPGLKIPNWQKVLDYCKQAALLIPKYGYIGWDVAVSNESVCIIEGNEVANVDLPQVACQRGMKKEYWQVMEETRKNRKKHIH